MIFKFNKTIFCISYFIVFVFVMLPYLKTGFYNDDSINSYLYAEVLLKGQSIYEYTIGSLKSWIQESGRFFPLTVMSGNYLWYYVFRHLEIYRALSFLAVLMNLYFFSYFLSALKQSTSFIRTFLLVILIFFQLRVYHDPIASYGLIYQVIMMIALVPSILLIRFYETQASKYLIGAWISYLFGIFFYEISLIWILVYLVVSYFSLNPKPSTLKSFVCRTCKPLGGFVVILGSYITLIMSIRLMYPRNYSGTKFGLSTKFFSAVFNQVVGAFPFTSFIFDSPEQDYLPYKILHQKPFLSILDTLPGLGTRAIVLALISSVLFYLVFKKQTQPRENSISDKRNRKLLYLLSFIFIAAPAILISLSEKYQKEVSHPTYPYLPVYLSYFGVSLSFTLCSEWFFKKFELRKSVLVGMAVFMGLALTLNTAINEVECERLNLISKYPRELYVESLHLGLLENVSSDSVIFHRRAHPYDTVWMNSAISFAESGKSLQFQPMDKWPNEEINHAVISGKSVYFLQWSSDNPDFRWIMRHRLKNMSGAMKSENILVLIQSVSKPKSVFLEDHQSDRIEIHPESIQTVKKGWYLFEVSDVNLDWSSTHVKSI